MNSNEIVEQVKERFEELTRSIPLNDYVDVCSELADEFNVRAEAGQADLDAGQE